MLKKEIRWFIADHDLEIVIAIIAIIGLVVGLIIYNVCGQSSEETLDVVKWVANPRKPAQHPLLKKNQKGSFFLQKSIDKLANCCYTIIRKREMERTPQDANTQPALF